MPKPYCRRSRRFQGKPEPYFKKAIMLAALTLGAGLLVVQGLVLHVDSLCSRVRGGRIAPMSLAFRSLERESVVAEHLRPSAAVAMRALEASRCAAARDAPFPVDLGALLVPHFAASADQVQRQMRQQWVRVAALVSAVGCSGQADDTELSSSEAIEARPLTEADFGECGEGLDALDDASSHTVPPPFAGYVEALADWPTPGSCEGAAVRGRCADGKELLYRNGGFTSEVRYFREGQLVGMVTSGDVGFCPSLCPFSHFYGSLDGVRCDVLELEPLCAGSSLGLDASGALYLPFANGQPPYGCQ